MKIFSSKLIKTVERGSLTIWNILFPNTLKRMYLYNFEVVIQAPDLKIGNELLGANHLRLLVVNKLSATNFVLQTNELHPCAPFLGCDIFVIARSFDKGSVNFCEKWKNDNIPFSTEEFTWIKINWSREEVKDILIKYWNETDGKNGLAVQNWIEKNI